MRFSACLIDEEDNETDVIEAPVGEIDPDALRMARLLARDVSFVDDTPADYGAYLDNALIGDRYVGCIATINFARGDRLPWSEDYVAVSIFPHDCDALLERDSLTILCWLEARMEEMRATRIAA